MKGLIYLDYEDNKFLENLTHQIGTRNDFFKKKSLQETQLNEASLKIKERIKILEYREIYKTVMIELESLAKTKQQ